MPGPNERTSPTVVRDTYVRLIWTVERAKTKKTPKSVNGIVRGASADADDS
jgi:hypothetical protein